MTREKRRLKSKLKDIKRRHLYLNHAINGRFEVKDESAEIKNNYSDSLAHRNTLDPSVQSNYERVKNGEGHWSQYPKNRYYGAKGYRVKQKTYREKKENYDCEEL